MLDLDVRRGRVEVVAEPVVVKGEGKTGNSGFGLLVDGEGPDQHQGACGGRAGRGEGVVEEVLVEGAVFDLGLLEGRGGRGGGLLPSLLPFVNIPWNVLHRFV